MNPSLPRLAVAAIFKNEGPYVLEWVAFHRALGVQHLFVADNDSNDETSGILRALAAAGILVHIPFPTEPGKPPQLAAYGRILERHGEEADWFAFIDADEFLVPTGGPEPETGPGLSLAAIISAIDPGPDVGAIVVNWAVYGSSGHKSPGSEPVIERFTERADRKRPMNRVYKTMVRPSAFAGRIQNPHYFHLKPGFRAIHVDGSPMVDMPGKLKGISARVVWEPLRVNHYIVKSSEEFHGRKAARGRATRFDNLRNQDFFRKHDVNDVADPVPAWLAQATAKERQKLETLIAEAAPMLASIPASADAHAHKRPGAAKGQPVPVPDEPSIPREGVEALSGALRQASCYLEYGSGGSTVLATDIGVRAIVSVESDRDWMQRLEQKLGKRLDRRRHFLIHADIGPTKAFGHPVSDAGWRTFHTYPLAAWDLCRRRRLVPDVVLVDGRFRVACLLATLLNGRPGCRVLFDDYAGRPHYHTIRSLVKPTRMLGRMADFTVPAAIDRDRVWEALLQAVTDPR